MFYIKYILWTIIYFLAWILYNLRFYWCRIFNTPFLPISFEVKELPAFWLYFLLIFYTPDNYLSKLPLLKSEKKDFENFQKYWKLNPGWVFNYRFNLIIKPGFINENFNNFKKDYNFFKKCVEYSKMFDAFFGKNLFFLKFLNFRRAVKNIKISFEYLFNNFYIDKNNFSKKGRKIFRSFTATLSLMLLFNHDYFTITNNFKWWTMDFFQKILNEKKTTFHKSFNYYFDEKTILWGNLRTLRRQKMVEQMRTHTNFYKNTFFDTYFYKELLLNFNFNFDFSIKLINFKNDFFLNNYPVKINTNFKQFLTYFWPTRVVNNGFSKFFDLNLNKNNILFFIRKNKIFNKGRYSRNRQLYRTGVYMCLWINVIFVYFYIFAFYRFTFNFGFFWFGIGLFILSMTFARAAKYRFYNPTNFLNEFKKLVEWLVYFFSNSLTFFIQFFQNISYYFQYSNQLVQIFFRKL